MSPGSFPTSRRSAPKKRRERPSSRKGSMTSFYPKRQSSPQSKPSYHWRIHLEFPPYRYYEIHEKSESDQLHRGKKVADFEGRGLRRVRAVCAVHLNTGAEVDRRSTRLNSSHPSISYAVFCLK